MSSAGHLNRNLRRQVQAASNAVLNLLFPARCACCGELGPELCDTCLLGFIPVENNRCQRCGELMEHESLCYRCLSTSREFERIRSAFRYEGTIKKAIHALKYRGRKSIAAILAIEAAHHLARPDSGFMLCAVPLHQTRLSERGYNQSHLLASTFAEIWSIPLLHEHALSRIRHSTPQAGSDYAARRANVDKAFRADARYVLGKNIMLVDDVCTTTATLDACAHALREGGANRIEGVTIARA